MIKFNLQTSTGIYVGVNGIYLAQAKRTFLGPRLVKFGKTEIQLPPPSSDEPAARKAMNQALHQALREHEITTKRVIVALSGKDVLIRYFQMPRIPKAEWQTAIRFEAKKFIPFKIEELMWDFHVVLPKAKDAKMDVTFVAVKTDTAKRYLGLFEQAGLKPLVLEPAPFSLLRLFTSSNQLAKDKTTAIVDVDYGMADINIVKNRICYLTRDVSLPLEAEVLFDNLLNEIRMSLEYYEKLFPTQAVGKILLCGEVELRDWDRKLSNELKISVEKVNLSKAIKIQRALPPLKMAVAIGLVLRSFSKIAGEVNLLQVHEVKPKVGITKEALAFTPEIRRAVIRAVALSCIGLLILHFAMYRRIGQEKKQLKASISTRPKISLPIDVTSSQSELEEISKNLKNKLSSLRLIIDERIFWTDKFNELPKAIPPGVWLTDLSLTDRLFKEDRISRILTLQGVAYHEDPVQEIGIVTKFVSNLKENEVFFRGFAEIKLDSMTSAKLEEMPVKNFIISCIQQ